MADLQGRIIVTLEGRMPSVLAGLIERHGGKPILAPAMKEVPLPGRHEVIDFINAISTRKAEMVIFLTGVGAKALLAASETLDNQSQLIDALKTLKVVCRGPKPLAVMRSYKIPVDLIPPEPFTTEVLIEALRAKEWNLKGKIVALQHYGEINSYIRDELHSMGAKVLEVSLYKWELPEDINPLKNAIIKIVDSKVDAVLFTTQIQIRHLFQVARQMDMDKNLRKAFEDRVIVAPVGPICVRALTEEGVSPHVVPKHPKMGPLVLAVAEYFDKLDVSITNPLRKIDSNNSEKQT